MSLDRLMRELQETLEQAGVALGATTIGRRCLRYSGVIAELRRVVAGLR